MTTFLNRDIASTDKPWPEWMLQAYVVQESRRAGYEVVGDMAAGKRNPGQAKATGIVAGEPDLRYYMPQARVVFIEMKTDDGVLSKAQKDRHTLLKRLGFEVHTVFAATPAQAWDTVLRILES